METFKRICIKDFELESRIGQKFSIKQGEEYLTSSIDENNNVMVFSSYWVNVPVSFFSGEVKFT